MGSSRFWLKWHMKKTSAFCINFLLSCYVYVEIDIKILVLCGNKTFVIWSCKESVLINESPITLVSQGIGIYTLVQPCFTSWLLWRFDRVSDCHPGDPGSIPVRDRSKDIFLHLSHLAPNVKSSYIPVQ